MVIRVEEDGIIFEEKESKLDSIVNHKAFAPIASLTAITFTIGSLLFASVQSDKNKYFTAETALKEVPSLVQAGDLFQARQNLENVQDYLVVANKSLEDNHSIVKSFNPIDKNKLSQLENQLSNLVYQVKSAQKQDINY